MSRIAQPAHRHLHSKSGSAKLFRDAAHEEAAQRNTPRYLADAEASNKLHQNWVGDESTHDAVLRMLVDKYKPLRTGSIRTAEEKLRSSTAPAVSPTQPLHEAEPALRPWMVTFKPPRHAVSVKFGSFSEQPPRCSETGTLPSYQVLKHRKRIQQAERITNAREKTLDYRLDRQSSHKPAIPNPRNVKGWVNLVEDRIAVCPSRPVLSTTFLYLLPESTSPRPIFQSSRQGGTY